MKRWWLLCALAGCGSDRLEIDIPTAPDDRAAIIALQTPDTLEVRATGVADPSGLPALDGYDGEDLSVHALLYKRPLDALGLTPGTLTHDPDRGEPLPAFDTALSTEIPVRWREIDALPVALESLRIPRRKTCPELSIVRRTLDVTDDAGLAVQIDDGSVIIGAGADIFRVRGPDEILRIPVPGSPHTSAGAHAGGNRVWLATTSSVVLVEFTDQARILRSEPHPPGGGNVSRMVAGVDELYTLSRRGPVSRLAGGQWSTLHNFGPTDDFSGLAYRSSGKIAAAAPTSTRVVLHNAGRTRLVEVPGVNTGITSLAQIDGFGVVLTQANPKQLYVLDDVGWRTLDNSLHRILACGMIGFAGGVLVHGLEGQGALYLPEVGVCALDVLTVQTAHYAARLGDGVVIPGNERNDQMQMTFINLR